MSNKYLDILTQIVRHPRHGVRESKQVTISVDRTIPQPDEVRSPDVADFSRGGCRLRWGIPLSQHEPIVLRITDHASGLEFEIAGKVRWTRKSDDGRYEAGCKFDQEIDYEQLGELFIAGFLAFEEAGTP